MLYIKAVDSKSWVLVTKKNNFFHFFNVVSLWGDVDHSMKGISWIIMLSAVCQLHLNKTRKKCLDYLGYYLLYNKPRSNTNFDLLYCTISLGHIRIFYEYMRHCFMLEIRALLVSHILIDGMENKTKQNNI